LRQTLITLRNRDDVTREKASRMSHLDPLGRATQKDE
jgi:hypothetical protein